MHGAETVGLLCIGDYRIRPHLEISQEITHNFLKVKRCPNQNSGAPVMPQQSKNSGAATASKTNKSSAEGVHADYSRF